MLFGVVADLMTENVSELGFRLHLCDQSYVDKNKSFVIAVGVHHRRFKREDVQLFSQRGVILQDHVGNFIQVIGDLIVHKRIAASEDPFDLIVGSREKIRLDRFVLVFFLPEIGNILLDHISDILCEHVRKYAGRFKRMEVLLQVLLLRGKRKRKNERC